MITRIYQYSLSELTILFYAGYSMLFTFRDWLIKPDLIQTILHTEYHEVEKFVSALNIKW